MADRKLVYRVKYKFRFKDKVYEGKIIRGS